MHVVASGVCFSRQYACISSREDDSRRIQSILSAFLGESNARTALIVDRTGQMVSTTGEAPAFDATAFASLTAAEQQTVARVS